MITTKEAVEVQGEAIAKFIEVTNEMVAYLQKEPQKAKQIYYDYSKEKQNELMDRIIEDTLGRFESTIEASSSRWKKLYEFLEELELVKLSQEEYDRIWVK